MLLAGSVNSDWYLGLTIGFVLVVVVVMVVAVILSYAARIADHTLVATEGLEEVRDGTAPLWAVRKTNSAAVAILDAARSAREAVVATLTGQASAPSGPSSGPQPPGEPQAAADPGQRPSANVGDLQRRGAVPRSNP